MASKKSMNVTIKSADDANAIISDGLAEAVHAAFSERAITFRQRANVVRRLTNTGLSARGIFAALTIKLGASMPDGLTSDTVISRYAAVNDVMTDERFLTITTSALAGAADKGAKADVQAEIDGIIRDLFRLTGGAGGSKKRASEAVATIPEGASLTVTAVHVGQAVAALSAERSAKVLGPVKGRAAHHNAPAVEQGEAETPEGEAGTPDVHNGAGVATLASRVSALADELTRLTPENVAPTLAEALADLIEVAESIVTERDVLTELLAD